MSTPNIIVGLEQPLEDPGTGVALGFHVLRVYQVDVLQQRTLVTLHSYVSRAAHAAGKNPVSSVGVGGLEGVPEVNPVQWCYQALLADQAGGQNALYGATPAYADEVAE